MDILQNYGSLALNDDYTYWHSNHDKSEFGKLFLIDRMDYNTHPIFFDDNVEDEDPHIVDPRDLIDGAQIPWKRVKNRYVVKVESDRAMLELDYFIKCVELCEKNRADEIYRREHGLPEEGESVAVTENKWTKLLSLPADEYILNTIAPLLSQGLKYVEAVRPSDPVATLAYYMLKHKKEIDIPKKPVEEKKQDQPKEEKKEEKNKEEKKEEKEEPKKEAAKEPKKDAKAKEEKKAEKQKEVKKAEKAK